MAESKLSKGMQTQEVQRPETVCPECQYYKMYADGSLAAHCREHYDHITVSEDETPIDENTAWLRFMCANRCKVGKSGIYKGDFAIAIYSLQEQISQLKVNNQSLQNQLIEQTKPQKKTIPNRNVGKKNVSEAQVGDLVRAMALDHTIDEIVAKVHWGKSTVMRLIHRDKIICREYSKRIGSQALSDEEKHIQLQKIANKVGIPVAVVLEILRENGVSVE